MGLPISLNALIMVSPSVAGDREMWTPASSKAANLAAAVPLPPLTIAPACVQESPGCLDFWRL